MTAKFSVLALAILLLAACEKTNFTTRPQLTLDKISDTVVRAESLLTFSFTLSDKEGDFLDSNVMFCQKISTSCPNANFLVRSLFPTTELTKNYKTELDVNFFYSNRQVQDPVGVQVIPSTGCLTRPGRPNDTCYFRFWAKDQGGNTSDTVRTGRIVLLRP